MSNVRPGSSTEGAADVVDGGTHRDDRTRDALPSVVIAPELHDDEDSDLPDLPDLPDEVVPEAHTSPPVQATIEIAKLTSITPADVTLPPGTPVHAAVLALMAPSVVSPAAYDDVHDDVPEVVDGVEPLGPLDDADADPRANADDDNVEEDAHAMTLPTLRRRAAAHNTLPGFPLDVVVAAADAMPAALASPLSVPTNEGPLAPEVFDGPLEPLSRDDEFDTGSEKTGHFRTASVRVLALDGSISTEEGATIEGPPVDDIGTDVGPNPPAVGTTLVASSAARVRLEDSLGEQGGMVFFRATVEGEEQAYTAVWSTVVLPEPPWEHLPDPRIVRPRCRVDLDRACVRVFERPKGNTVVDYLGDDDRLLPAMATLELGIELAELLESLHGAGQHIYDLDPSQLVIERGGRVRLYAVGGLYAPGPLPYGAILGPFAAPEVRRRMGYLIGAHSDVYAVALLLYALFAKRAPIDIDLDPQHLVSPRVFRPECPLGIWPYLRPCLEGQPARRVGHARALRAQLELARQRLINEARATEEAVPVTMDAWAEQHTGITKARRGSGQQDRALSVTHEDGRVGLYMIADGVSRSKFGDGAFAAEQVEIAALQRWTGLEKAGGAALELNHAQRTDVMKQIARSAGKRISSEVNARYAPLVNEPNQVMSATMVAMFVVHGEASIGNLGDSRAYLIRDRILEQITIDHDRNTDALRMGLGFRDAATVSMGSALTRVVGRVVIDPDGNTRPDPFDPEMFRLRLLPGDRLLLCSDGVADFAAGAGASELETEQKMLETVLEHEDPAYAAFELVVLANRAGGYDNISCVVVAVRDG